MDLVLSYKIFLLIVLVSNHFIISIFIIDQSCVPYKSYSSYNSCVEHNIYLFFQLLCDTQNKLSYNSIIPYKIFYLCNSCVPQFCLQQLLAILFSVQQLKTILFSLQQLLAIYFLYNSCVLWHSLPYKVSPTILNWPTSSFKKKLFTRRDTSTKGCVWMIDSNIWMENPTFVYYFCIIIYLKKF